MMASMWMMIYLAVLVFVLGSIGWSTWKTGISPAPTMGKVRSQLLELIVQTGNRTIYELGSGWGHLAIPIAQKHSSCRVIGYEVSLLPYLVASGLAVLLRLSNLKVFRRDFLVQPLREADLVICYLYPKMMERLKAKFERELPSGSTVISHTFCIPGWQAKQIFVANDWRRTPIYVYQID